MHTNLRDRGVASGRHDRIRSEDLQLHFNSSVMTEWCSQYLLRGEVHWNILVIIYLILSQVKTYFK